MSATSTPTAKAPSRIWFVVGLVAALAPAILFVIAAFAGPGPATSVAIYSAPVILCIVGAVVIAILLLRAGARSRGRAVLITAIVVAVIAGGAWIYLATLAAQFGDGPL